MNGTRRRCIVAGPMTCVVNADGRLEQAIPGEMTEADVLELAVPAPPGKG